MVGSKNCHREHDIAWHEEKNSTYINSFDRFKWLHTQMYVKVKNSRTIPTRQAYVFQTFLRLLRVLLNWHRNDVHHQRSYLLSLCWLIHCIRIGPIKFVVDLLLTFELFPLVSGYFRYHLETFNYLI